MNYVFLIDRAKDVAAAAGVGGVIWSAYSVSGLPVPATLKQVEQRIAAVNETITKNQTETKRALDLLTIDQLDGRRSVIRLSRISLRNELANIQRIMPGVDANAKLTLGRRLGEIGDTLKELEDADGDLRDRIDKLR